MQIAFMRHAWEPRGRDGLSPVFYGREVVIKERFLTFNCVVKTRLVIPGAEIKAIGPLGFGDLPADRRGPVYGAGPRGRSEPHTRLWPRCGGAVGIGGCRPGFSYASRTLHSDVL